MISIIVYGRNDDRGYGMAKRVALGLNTMAHVLSGEASEILFVDYNTPDHLPTLPEAIADTLTEAARKRLRVFRVRPAVHARFADLTPLPVLEPVARNVALRRSSARNRWILSTNTDAILAPRVDASLEAIVASLDKASYGVPRFELPERAWEGFNRLDPAATLAGARAWGRMGRLDETVMGEGAVLFDGPGDFQLVPRADLFAIDGFDEEMLLGWHVDHNLAVRLAMRLGPARSLADRLALYHCGHIRQSTQTHGHARVENDTSRFVSRVTSAECPGQRDAWGCPDDPIEEIRLDRSRPAELLAIAGAIMPPLDTEPLEARYASVSFASYGYDAGHVTTHVLDLVSTFAAGTVFGYAGVRRDTFALLRAGLSRLGFRYRVLVPDTVAERLDVTAAPDVQVTDAAAFAEAVDLPLFEFGLIRDETGEARRAGVTVEPTEAETTALEAVRAIFQHTAAAERARLALGLSPRLFITVNAVHNPYETSVAEQLAATAAPFSTRLRYGPLAGVAGAAEAEPLARRLARQAGLAADPTALDIMRARALLRDIVSGGADDGSRDLEIAASADLIAALVALGAGGPLPEGVRAAVEACIARAREPRIAGPFHTARGDMPPGMASLSAWRDPAWRAQAQRLADAGSRRAVRNGWIWERGQLLWAMARRAEAGKGRALVVCEHPDRVIGGLDGLFEAVDVIDIRRLAGEAAPRLTRLSDFGMGAVSGRTSFQAIETVGTRPAYAAVILPHASGFLHGLAGLADLVGKLRPVLVPGGLLAVTGEVGMNGRVRPSRPDRALAGPDGFAQLFARHAGLRPVEPLPARVPEADAALVGTPDDLAEGRPVLGLIKDGDVLWPSVWLFEAVEGDLDAPRLSEAMRLATLGEQLAALRTGPAARHENGVITGVPGEAGHLVYGPYLTLPPGGYRAIMELEGEAAMEGRGARLVAEVSLGLDVVAAQEIVPGRSRRFRQTVDLPFTQLPPADGSNGAWPLCECRLWSDGQSRVTVRSVRVERAGRLDALRR